LQAAVDEALLYRDEAGAWQVAAPDFGALSLPRSLHQLVERRLEGLPTEAARLVSAAAVLGQESELELAAQVAALQGEALQQALDGLRRGGVREGPAPPPDPASAPPPEPASPPGPASAAPPALYCFVHGKLREVACERLSPHSRRALHLAA